MRVELLVVDHVVQVIVMDYVVVIENAVLSLFRELGERHAIDSSVS